MIKLLLLGLAGMVLLVSPVWCQDILQQEAVSQAKMAFEGLWIWNGATESWYLAYTIPINPFTPVLGQTGPIQRYVQAKKVGFSVHVRRLTPADQMNGLDWSGTVSFTAELSREYDVVQGWLSWMNKRTLETYTLEKRHGTWQIGDETMHAAPSNSTVRLPAISELPGDAEGPRRAPVPQAPPPTPYQPWEKPTPDGRCRPWRAPYGGAGSQNRPEGSGTRPTDCRLTCSQNDRFCGALVNRLIERDLCHEGPQTIGLYNRMSDIGHYYCQQKQQRGKVNPDAIRRQWEGRFRPDTDSTEESLDIFAVETARSTLCP